jgi:hypothetical protein
MQRMRNVTSAENLLQLLRSGRESQDAPSLLHPSSCPFEPALTQAKELPLTEAALKTLHNNQTRMLDAALHLLEHPIATMPLATTMPQSLPLPGDFLQRQIPLTSLQANELLGSGFAPVSDYLRGQGPGNSAGDEQTGSLSEDTHQDILRGGGNNDNSSHGAAIRPVQMISDGTTTTARQMMQRQQQQLQQQQQISGRPQRQTAKRALEKFGGSTHQSVADDDEEFNEDELSGADDASDACGKRMHRSSSGAQSFQRATTANGLGADDGGKISSKQSGRPLKRKPYDSLVDPTLPPEEIRRIRRILSNRESARRSRKRKATQIAALEDELMEVRMAATELETELIEALTHARAAEKDKLKLLAEVDVLRKKVTALEAAPAAAAEMGIKTAPVPISSGVVLEAPAAVPIPVPVNLPDSLPVLGPLALKKQQQPLQMLQRELSLPLLPPIKIKEYPAAVAEVAAAAGSLTAPPVASTPIAATAGAGARASPTEEDPLSAGITAAGGITTRRASPNAHHTSARSQQFQSPLRQGSSQVSHRIRFRPVPAPKLFPDAPFEGNMHLK